MNKSAKTEPEALRDKPLMFDGPTDLADRRAFFQSVIRYQVHFRDRVILRFVGRLFDVAPPGAKPILHDGAPCSMLRILVLDSPIVPS